MKSTQIMKSIHTIEQILQYFSFILERNSFFDQDKDEIEDSDFNQDIDFDDNDNIRSPGWIRYQKKLK